MGYKKMNEDQLKELFVNLKGYFHNRDKYSNMVKIVNKYFNSDDIYSILVSIHSVYNDEGYDNRISSINVYGSNDVELVLTKEKRQKFNKESKKLYLGESTEGMEDVIIYVNKDLPEIYIKS